MSHQAPTATAEATTLRRCALVIFAASCAAIALGSLARFSGDLVWDDAFMFARYADHLLAHGVVAWNPDGTPTYGLTSLGYLAFFLPFRLFVPQNAPLALVAASWAGGAVFLALLAALVARHVDGGREKPPAGSKPAGGCQRWPITAAVFLFLAFGITHLNQHFTSGMDTTLSMAWLSLYILGAKWHERSPGLGRAVAVGVLGGLTYLVRPDLMLYAAAAPLALFLLAPGARERKAAFVMGATTLIVLGLELAWARWYFGTAFPLPFYAKGADLYGEGPREFHRMVPIRELAVFAATYWLPLGLAALGVVARWRRRPAVDLALAAASALFVAYHLLWTLQIMGWAARFYYPAFPAIIFLAAQGAAWLVHRAGEGGWRLPRPAAWLATLLALYALTPQVRAVAQEIQARRKQGAFARFDLVGDFRRTWEGWWPRLDRFIGLPDGLAIAVTDVGRPGALARGKRVYDMAGLNDAAFAFQRFSAERFFQHCRPDVLYMPNFFYKDMNRQLRASEFFRERYELFTAKDLAAATGLPAVFDVALFRDSPHYAELRRILLEPWAPPPGGMVRYGAEP